MNLHSSSLVWEYRDFSYRQWQPDELRCSLTGAERASEQLAREFIWKKASQRIEAEIVQWRDNGWEPAEPIGPQAITFQESTEKSFQFTYADVFMWILTLGIGFLAQLAFNLPRQYVI